MIRTCLTALLLCVTAQFAFANEKDERCAQFGQMSADLVALRQEGVSETDAILALGKTYENEPVSVLQVIPVLSSWVFGLSDEDLKGDVAGAMTEQCKAAV